MLPKHLTGDSLSTHNMCWRVKHMSIKHYHTIQVNFEEVEVILSSSESKNKRNMSKIWWKKRKEILKCPWPLKLIDLLHDTRYHDTNCSILISLTHKRSYQNVQRLHSQCSRSVLTTQLVLQGQSETWSVYLFMGFICFLIQLRLGFDRSFWKESQHLTNWRSWEVFTLPPLLFHFIRCS